MKSSFCVEWLLWGSQAELSGLLLRLGNAASCSEQRAKYSSKVKRQRSDDFKFPRLKKSDFYPKAASCAVPLLPGDCRPLGLWLVAIPCCSLSALAPCPAETLLSKTGMGCHSIWEVADVFPTCPPPRHSAHETWTSTHQQSSVWGCVTPRSKGGVLLILLLMASGQSAVRVGVDWAPESQCCSLHVLGTKQQVGRKPVSIK